jgi:acetyl esterase/lipase
MSFAFDPEFEAVVRAALAQFEPPPPTPRGDAVALRLVTDGLQEMMKLGVPEFPEIERRSFEATTSDGTSIPLRWYASAGAGQPGSAVLYIHGGGMICGSVDVYDRVIAGYVAAAGVPMLAVDYRLAPEHPHPYPAEDCFAALTWLFDHASELGIDAKRIAVMGDSGGGGLAAAVALMARDRNLTLARQILIYPMLDDRNVVPDPELVPFAGWTYDNNYTGWHALLGDALAKDLRGVAPAYVEVGELDIFRDEDIDYARRLGAAGVSSELHVHPGVPHGFERAAADSDVGKRAMADRYRVLKSL